MMGKSTRFWSCSSLLAVVILATVQSANSQGSMSPLDASVRKLIAPEGAFLAGEDTPVWLAYKEGSDYKIGYRRLEKGIVGKAIEHWKSGDFKGVRRARSVGSKPERVDRYHMERAAQEIMNQTQSNSRDRVKRGRGGVSYPSILVLMSYITDWPSGEKDQYTLIMERILYALAFWTGVDLQLREIDDPQVRLRVAGIVIGQDRDVMPQHWTRWTLFRLDYKDTLTPMIEYWDDQMRKKHKDQFHQDGYNVVAMMTDRSPAWHNAASTSAPPCNYEYRASLGGLIFEDDLAFDGLQTAVLMTSRILGQGYDAGTLCQYKSKYANRWWDKCDLDMISTMLGSRGWCFKQPKEFHKPGKPVEMILPGKLIPASKQCVARGWADGNVCWHKMDCKQLYCSNNSIWWCGDSGLPVDGTTCGTGKMCLNTECVANTTLIGIK